MPAALRIKLIGEDHELDHLEPILSRSTSLVQARRFADLDEACEAQEEEPSEIFILGTSNFFQSHLNQIQKSRIRPQVMLAVGEKVPNLAKILVPKLIYSHWGEEEILCEIETAADTYRRSRRLEALRDHHRRSWNPDSNPAINLVTNLMRRCTSAEEYRDLLSAVLSLRSVIDFHDAALLVLDGDNRIVEAWSSAREQKDKTKEIPIEKLPTVPLFSSFPDGEVRSFSSSGGAQEGWDHFANHPWSFGLSLKFSRGTPLIRSKKGCSAVIVLYRRELLPFLERDLWLLEMSYGPLTLALEKIGMLKAIGQASKEWRTTFDGISEPLTVINSNYQIVKANKAFARMVDQDIKKLKTKRCYSLMANRRTPCVGCPVGMEAQSPGGTRIQSHGKSKKDLLVWSYGIRTGMESYFFQFYRNVSKETLLASTLIQSEKMAALGRLVGAVAHEINNPLAGILATSQILLKEIDPAADPSLADDLEEIRSAAVRSKKIIEDLLGFTEPGERQKESVNLLAAVRSTLLFSKAALSEVKIEIKSESEDFHALIPANSLQQVLFNLITNAVQAMNGKGLIEIGISRNDGNAMVYIKDSGPGIPPDKMKHIFDPFFTSKQEGSGTGLGLSIVRSLVQKMNGRIDVVSKVGEGTTFTLLLPLESEGSA